jgi:hypothetical protein
VLLLVEWPVELEEGRHQDLLLCHAGMRVQNGITVPLRNYSMLSMHSLAVDV